MVHQMKTIHRPLLNWLKSASEQEIVDTGTTKAYLRLIGYGQKSASAEMAVGIEKATLGSVTRKMLRPADWHRLWPELAEALPTLNQKIRPISPVDQSADDAGNLYSIQ